MYKTIQNLWTTQSNYTRIAVSVALALAVCSGMHFIANELPSLVEMHRMFYQHFETRANALNTLTTYAFVFMLAWLTLTACLSAYEVENVHAMEGEVYAHMFAEIGVFIVLIFGVFMPFAMIEEGSLIALSNSNWWYVGAIILHGIVGLVLIFGPMVIFEEETWVMEPNPVFQFWSQLFLTSVFFLVPGFSQTNFIFWVALIVLAALLNPIGNKHRNKFKG